MLLMVVIVSMERRGLIVGSCSWSVDEAMAWRDERGLICCTNDDNLPVHAREPEEIEREIEEHVPKVQRSRLHLH